MALNISAWSIRNPVPAIAFFTLLALIGGVAWTKMPVQAMPTINVPIIQVGVVQPGATPTDLEKQVTRRIESALTGINGVKHVTSNVQAEASYTTVEFRLDVPVDRAATDVRDAVSRIRQTLPAGIREPVIERIDITGLPILTYAVAGAGKTEEELSWFVDDTVVRELSSLAGVGQVRREGGTSRELRVELDPRRLAALGITADQVDERLRTAVADLPGGRADLAGQQRLVRVLGGDGRGTVESLARVRIALPGSPGTTVAVADLGRVVDGGADPTVLARRDGVPVVGFSILRAKGASEVEVEQRISSRLDQLQASHPWAVFTREVDMVKYTRESFEQTMSALFEGAALAVLVVLVFLRDWRVTLISAVAIPLSILPTIAAMLFFGFTLNGVSLLALSLVAGVLVDDAIVEVENIVRHQGMGFTPYRASLIAADRIGLAVVATTLSIVAVFLPVSAMPGIAGKYFVEFGITVAVAVTASLLVARLLTPMMTAYLLHHAPPAEHGPGAMGRWYHRRLAWCIDHRWSAMAIGLGLFVLAMTAGTYLPSGFISASDRAQAIAIVELPPGTTIARAEQTVAELSSRIRARSEVSSIFARIEVPRSTLTISLVPKEQRALNQQEVQRDLRRTLAEVPDQRFGFLGENMQKEVQIQLLGDDAQVLAESARALAAGMRAMPELANVSTAADQPRPELTIRPKPEEAARLGVDAGRLARLLAIATQGDDETVLTKLTVADTLAVGAGVDRQVPLRVQLDPAARTDLDVLRGLRVPTNTGASVPLGAVADLALAEGAATVTRYDRRRAIMVEADLGTASLGEALAAVERLPARTGLPAGIQVAPAGDAEIMGELFGGFALAMALGVLLVYVVLVLLYHDLFQPITILAALPLSVGGAVLGLFLFDKALDMAALIGLLMLMGIVCKNSILLVDEALQGRADGRPRREALLHAGAVRSRPIIMTTLAMIGGMLPAALGIGSGAEFRQPMAITVIGGLIASTALSLLFIPAVYTVVDDLRLRLGRLGARLVTMPSAEDQAPE